MQDRERITMSARNAFGIAFLLALSLLQFGCSEDSPANNSSNKPANVAFNAADNQNTAGNTYKSVSNVSPVPPKCSIKDELNLKFECPKGETVRVNVRAPDDSSYATIKIDKSGAERIPQNGFKEFIISRYRKILVVYHPTQASGNLLIKLSDRSGDEFFASSIIPSSVGQRSEQTFEFDAKSTSGGNDDK